MKPKLQLYAYYFLLVLIVAFSAYYYLPPFYSFFNSDMAIHVLMTKDFELPRDYYYWGQSRLGSLLPMVAHGFYTLLKVHPVYICSAVHFLFLLLPFLLISRCIQNKWLRLSLLCLFFLPFNSYNALLYVGHPYSQQLFCGTLFIAAFLKVQLLTLDRQAAPIRRKDWIRICMYLFFSVLFFTLGVWVSEFNAILLLVPFLLILARFKSYRKALPLKQAVLLAAWGGALLVSGYLWFRHTKKVSAPDEQYSKVFITDPKSISAEYDFMVQKIKAIFDYSSPGVLFENTIYLLFFLAVAFIIYKRKEIRAAGSNTLSHSLIATALLSSVVLFFSFWNFRSEFCPRYYIPVYLMIVVALVLYLDRIRAVFFNPLFFLLVLFHGSMYTYQSLIRFNAPSPFDTYADFSTLPPGTLIADYWETHLIQAVAADNLNSINFMQNPIVRTAAWKEEALSADRFYFLNNETAKMNGLTDTITQFNIRFVYTGIRHPLRAAEVLEYKKLP